MNQQPWPNASRLLVFCASTAASLGMLESCTETASPSGSAAVRSRDPAESRAQPHPLYSLASVSSENGFVGSEVCGGCHRKQAEGHSSSHHFRGFAPTNGGNGREQLDGAAFTTKRGGTTTFSDDGAFLVVATKVPLGDSSVLPAPYVSGVWPLQQYVVAGERGKLQCLGVARDTRSVIEGGQRWFHVYGNEGIAPSDPLFFTAPAQNWNHMCADCHSTLVERRYDVAADRFDTTWAELSVGCEACHGPGAEHVRNVKGKPVLGDAPLPNLRVARGWRPSVTGSPTPRPQRGREVETCAPCHSRRAPIAEGFHAGDALLDHFEPELLLPGRYHADGQVEGEVYEWGSFTQSRMYQAGVACSDCHEPHSAKLYATGNELCLGCHESSRFEAPSHSHHSSSNSPQCVDCHMPKSTFMQIDERRDHSIRLPRPDHSIDYGTPNACNSCHTNRTANWARDWTRQWYPTLEGRPHFVDALAKDRLGAPDAPRRLRGLASDSKAPGIARATALSLLGNYPSAKSYDVLRAALTDDDDLVIYGAALGAMRLAPAQRRTLVEPLLDHEARAVRVAAGKALASAGTGAASPSSPKLLQVFQEVERSFDVRASRAETHVEKGAFELARGDVAGAAASLSTALRLDECLVEAHVNAAEIERQRQNEDAAFVALRRGLICNPQHAGAHYALGLWYVRAKKPRQALHSLRRAVELAPTDARFSYVLAVAQASRGGTNEAIETLRASLVFHPNDIQSLQALAHYLSVANDAPGAAVVEQRLRSLSSD